MRIVTWNLGYWQHASSHDEGWDYLRSELRPDIALLQEVRPPSSLLPQTIVFREVTRGWGTAVYAPSFRLSSCGMTTYPGRLAMASLDIESDLRLIVASIHAPIIDGRVFPHLNSILTEIETRLDGSPSIIGGDLNSARLAETVWPDCGHGLFFEGIDRGEIWVDCCRRFHPKEVQTFFRANSIHPFQDDHIFTSPGLSDCIRSCEAVDNKTTRSVSDHIPLLAEIDVVRSPGRKASNQAPDAPAQPSPGDQH